jgi:RNA polymerase sigma-70 factor, ECF subfamily
LEGHTFHSIYSSFYRKSFLYVKSYVHDDLIAEDIVSDSLIKIWEKVQHDNSVKVAPYLFTILKNSALDHLKHEKVKRQAISAISGFMNRDMEIRLSTLEASDPDYIFSSEASQIIRETLEKLPPKTRHIFEMSRFEGKTYKEIASYFNISEKGIEYHIFQALSALRKSLKDYLPVWLYLLYKI